MSQPHIGGGREGQEMPADSQGVFSMDLMAAKSIQPARWESGEWNGMGIQRNINTFDLN